MDLRVTQQTVIQTALSDTQRLSTQLATLQSQAASGKKFVNVSDDPIASLAILASSAQDQRIGAHLANIQTATSALNSSVSALQQVSSIFSSARSIAIEASNSANDPASFRALADQVDGLLNHLLNLANTQQDNTFIFGGSGSDRLPFVVVSKDAQGNPLKVEYQGTENITSAIVDTRQQIAMYTPGSDVFMGRHRQSSVFTGTTGAKTGAGTNTAVGQRALELRHMTTIFAPGSGVQPGSDSPGQDTILGSTGSHKLHISDTSGIGAAGTVSLDDGTAVSFTNADTNLRVMNSDGEAVYLNMTTITAGFNGAVDITANGSMSIDGGATSTAITFDSNQPVTDSETGQIIYVDTSAIKRTGTEIVDHPGTSDAFQSLITLRDRLRNVGNLSPNDQIKAISSQIGELENVHQNILSAMGQQSASLQTLDVLQSHLQDMQTAAKKNVSELGDIDLSQVVVNLQVYQQKLQMSLATFARINGQSLLDFLR